MSNTFLTDYRAHTAERAALGIPPLPLDAKQVADHVVLTESALDNQEVAIVFKPRQEWPKMFKFLKLYRDPPDAKV